MFWLGQLGLVVLTGAAATAALIPSEWAKRLHRLLTAIAFIGGGLAVMVLTVAFATEDWRFAYTVGHARPDIAWPLRVAGLWAGPEGSLLLWTTMLAGATVICAFVATSSWSTRLLALLTAGYGLTLLTVSFPFDRLAAPPGGGNGLQPVLEHPAMVWHPPILYVGLIGLLVPVAFILGAAMSADRAAPDATGPALSLALAVLTVGLATGANWAYVELGWGGYWAWDPIENAGLVAWLGAASMLHRFGPINTAASNTAVSNTAVSGQPSPALAWSVVGSAALTGAAVVWATTITRTGVLNSVHAFANEPRLRAVLLTIAVGFTVVVFGAAFGRTRSVVDSGRPPIVNRSRTGAVVVLVAAGVVAVGTYEPAIEVALRDNPFTLSGRFFTVLLWPVAIVGSAARVWSTVKAGRQQAVLGSAVFGAIGAMVVVGAGVGPFGLGLAAAGGAVAGTAVVDSVSRRSPSWVAHLGLGLLLIGIAGTIASTRTTVVALVDQQAETAVGSVIHRGVEIEELPGTTQAVATLELVDGSGDRGREFRPRLVRYLRTGGSSAEVDTDRGWLTDTQVVLIDADARQATYRINRHPRISLVWLGSLITIVGLAVSAVGDLRSGRRTTATTQRSAPRRHLSRPEPTD